MLQFGMLFNFHVFSGEGDRAQDATSKSFQCERRLVSSRCMPEQPMFFSRGSWLETRAEIQSSTATAAAAWGEIKKHLMLCAVQHVQTLKTGACLWEV